MRLQASMARRVDGRWGRLFTVAHIGSSETKVACRKLCTLELAEELGYVSNACKIMGYSRQRFYEIRRNLQTYGAEGLLDRLPGAKGPHPNRVASEVDLAEAIWQTHREQRRAHPGDPSWLAHTAFGHRAARCF